MELLNIKINKIFFILFLIISSCYATETKKVSLQLQWKYQFQFAGYIMAKEKGFYKDVGLDVDIKEWNYDIDMVDEVINGHSEYAVARPTSLIDISNGKKIIYLATIFQSSPLILLTDKSSGITSIKDFKHKRVMTTGDLNSDTSLLSMMFSHNISLEDLDIQKPSFNPSDLLDGKTDLMAAYISNEPFILKEKGGSPVIFSPKDYGFNFYNDMIITSQKHLLEAPQEVKNFKEATLKGWEYAFSHIQESVHTIYKKYNTQKKSKNALNFEANELKKLAYFRTDTLGKMEKYKLEKVYDVYKLLGLIQKKIDFDEIIYDQYIAALQLSQKEKEYLQKKKTITMCIDPNWMPFEHFDEDGNYEGMSADYFNVLTKNLGVDFRVIKASSWSESVALAKERKCDILSLAMQTPQRKKYWNFTTPYLKIPLVVATRLNVPFINDIKDLEGKKIGIAKDYAFVELLKKQYPELNIIEVENIDDGLQRVKERELFGYIGTLATIGYRFQNKYGGDLKITGKIAENWELGIGVRNDDPILLTILEKGINQITKEQHREILNRWISIKYEKGKDYSALWKVIGVFTLIALLGIYIMRKQEKLKRNLKETNEKLERAYYELQQMAITDKLTQLYNRHELDRVLEKEKSRADRYGQIFGVMIIDIDFFKMINDTYGHHTGDTILKDLATILKVNSRESDIIGRWGGEEFLIIVPQVNEESISTFAHILRKKVEQHLFIEKHKVTISIGITIYRVSEPIEVTISRADEALYMSKNKGRNLVHQQ
ncbi:ABC transporter substrate-binding protein [Sulfurimonas sp.]|uniref:ABC transporter substrate-binding protein n=1 Tax=Sulfurimonas sp. TaxID=2022749 RepID=UPI003D1385C4